MAIFAVGFRNRRLLENISRFLLLFHSSISMVIFILSIWIYAKHGFAKKFYHAGFTDNLAENIVVNTHWWTTHQILFGEIIIDIIIDKLEDLMAKFAFINLFKFGVLGLFIALVGFFEISSNLLAIGVQIHFQMQQVQNIQAVIVVDI